MIYLRLPNFAWMCPNVDAHFNRLTPTSPATRIVNIHHARFLCVFIRWTLINANPMIPPINAVLESVNTIAAIHIMSIEIFNIVFLFAVIISCIDVNFCLKNNMITGRNAMRKYP